MKYQLPSPGSLVAIKVKVPNPFLFAKEDFSLISYSGTVLQRDSWMKPTDIKISTGKAEFPVAIISAPMIADLKVLSGKTTAVNVSSDVRQFKVTSKESGKSYIVTLTGTTLHCTCTGFGFRRKCKHSAAVAKKQQN